SNSKPHLHLSPFNSPSITLFLHPETQLNQPLFPTHIQFHSPLPFIERNELLRPRVPEEQIRRPPGVPTRRRLRAGEETVLLLLILFRAAHIELAVGDEASRRRRHQKLGGVGRDPAQEASSGSGDELLRGGLVVT
ncbi:unnamed protein product, partial [Linum tenue]